MSVGNQFIEIDLGRSKTTLISGANGTSKSTFIEAIVFALYGKPFRKINKPQLINSINRGYMILVGLTHSDDEQVVTKMAEKILKLRVIPDEDDKMNLSIKDIEGEILSISQFTLYADSKKGNRPSYTDAMHPDKANELYELFNSYLNEEVKTYGGVFGGDMKVSLINDGPITINLEM